MAVRGHAHGERYDANSRRSLKFGVFIAITAAGVGLIVLAHLIYMRRGASFLLGEIFT